MKRTHGPRVSRTFLGTCLELCFSSFNVHENAWDLVKMQTLVQYLWDGTSKLPGDPADAVSKALGYRSPFSL